MTGRATADSSGQSDGSSAADQGGAPPAPMALRTEYEIEPTNLWPESAPRFTWRVPSDDRGSQHSAYRVLVADSRDTLNRNEGTIWDSGRTDSGQSTTVSYDGVALSPDTTYYWKVRVFDSEGLASPWSTSSMFTTAIGDDAFDGEWIGALPEDLPVNDQTKTEQKASPLLRQEFTPEKPIARARAHIVTLGYGELYLNGERVGEEVLNPAWTTYDRGVLYSSYDVTDRLQDGTNAVGVWLGRGWFSKSTAQAIIGVRPSYGPPRALLQFEIEYTDGASESVLTDTSWTTAPSPITRNDIHNGEHYDACLEQPGWAEPGFDDSGWASATNLGKPPRGGQGTQSAPRERPSSPDDPEIRPQRAQAIEVTQTLEPAEIHEAGGGQVIDFGQNHAGWIELTIRGADVGEEIVIEHAELLDESGDLDTASNADAEATDRYFPAGEDVESYEPRFTYHGFRYAKVTGYPGDLAPEDITSKVVRTSFEKRGSFSCSNEDLNRVQEAAEWTLRSNAFSVPTDCPQRNERHGWTGDGHMTGRTDLFNFDAVLFYEKWMDDHADNIGVAGSQSDTIPHANGSPEDADPNWAKTQVTIPWFLYQHTGDKSVLREHYEDMKAYVNYRDAKTGKTHLVPPEEVHYADWLAYEGSDKTLVGTFALYQATDLVARIADVLGKTADAETYQARAEDIAAAFNAAYFDPDEDIYAKEAPSGGDDFYAGATQCEQALPLFLGIVPGGHEAGVAETLAELVRSAGEVIQTGFVGTRPLLFALVEYGYEELAYEVVSQPERPGWVYMVRNGATTLWEWFGVGNQAGPQFERGARIDRVATLTSRNHRPLPLVSEWFYRVLAGIEAAEPGFAHIEFDPTPVGDLDYAEASVDTIRGEVASRWELIEDGIAVDATVPWNSTATVRLPDVCDSPVHVTEDEHIVWNNGTESEVLPDGVKSLHREDDTVVVEVGSGDYSFILQCGYRADNGQAPVGKFECGEYSFDRDERFGIVDMQASFDRVS